MTTIFLLVTFVLIAAAILAFLFGLDGLADPFGSDKEFGVGLLFTLGASPALLVCAFLVNDTRVNYCPHLEPIAAPDLAEFEPEPAVLVEPINDDELIAHNHALGEMVAQRDARIIALLGHGKAITGMHEVAKQELKIAKNELAARTQALQVASSTINEQQNEINGLRNELKQRSAQARALVKPTGTPCPPAYGAQPVTTPPCKGPRCSR